MAVLEKIRTKFGIAASIIIAIGLLSFIIDPSQIETAMSAMSSKYDVGSIGGKSVSYTDFQSEIERMTTINEMLTGSSVQNAEQQAQIREAVWQNFVYRNLFIKKSKAAGIYVGDDEVVDLTSGANLSPLIAQNPAFMDENGAFSKDQLIAFINNIDSDASGSLRLYWNFLQENILNQQYLNKYSSLFIGSSSASPLMISDMVAGNNTTADVEYVMLPFGYEQDSTIVVSDDEIRTYYNNHKDFYRQVESRDIEYVVYEVKPSNKDIEDAKSEVSKLFDEFSSTDNMKNFLLKNSDRPYSEYWYKSGELIGVSLDVDKFVRENQVGSVSDIIAGHNKFYVAKIMDDQMIPDSAYVKHILLQGDNAASQADSLLTVIKKGENFSNIAALYSVDSNSADNGELGNIGWLTSRYMIPGFESIFQKKKNEPFILNTQYGTHIVLVSDFTKPVGKKQVAILEKEVLASKETYSAEYNKANDFASMAAGSLENYQKAVDSLGVYSHPFNNMLESTDKLGSVEDAKEVTRWAYDNKPGKVSNIITVNNNFFIIAAVKNIHKEGYATVNEVASTIQQRLYFEKMSQKKTAEVTEKIAGMTDINAIAEKLGTSVNTLNAVSFASVNAQPVDPALLGLVASAKEGTVTVPVAGQLGVYIANVTARNSGSFYTEEDAKASISQQKTYLTQTVIPVMMQQAEVKDNRAKFY